MFKEDAKILIKNLEQNLSADYHNLVGITLVSIDDLFFILRKCALRVKFSKYRQ